MSDKAKQIILEKIKKGLGKGNFKDNLNETYDKNEIYKTQDASLIEIFQKELTKIKGEYFYFHSEDELIKHLKNIDQDIQPVYCSDKHLIPYLEQAGIKYYTNFDEIEIKTGISSCEYLVARFGSVMVSSALPGSRKVFAYPHTHIVIAKKNQLVAELEDALEGIQKKYVNNLPSQIINIAGPSRTADIEKTLILGAHGPKKMIVFVLES